MCAEVLVAIVVGAGAGAVNADAAGAVVLGGPALLRIYL